MQDCQECGQRRPTFLDVSDDMRYCKECWVAFYGQLPGVRPDRPTAFTVPATPAWSSQQATVAAQANVTEHSTAAALAAVGIYDTVHSWLLCSCGAKWPPGSISKNSFRVRRSICKNHGKSCQGSGKYRSVWSQHMARTQRQEWCQHSARVQRPEVRERTVEDRVPGTTAVKVSQTVQEQSAHIRFLVAKARPSDTTEHNAHQPARGSAEHGHEAEDKTEATTWQRIEDEATKNAADNARLHAPANDVENGGAHSVQHVVKDLREKAEENLTRKVEVVSK